MKDQMPICAAFVAECRELFGAESINPEIRKGMHGEPTFYASENGHELGTKDTRQGLALTHIEINAPARTAPAGRRGK
jgi:hypothetical protein